MKSTTPTLSLLLGVLATTVLAQEVAPVTVETVTVAPLTGDDGSAVVDQFPVPVEMAKRDVANQSLVQRFTSSLTKRHYGVFTCSYSLNNYCKQFLGQEGVGNLVGCDGGVCYVGCGVSGYTRTNDVNDICVNYNTDITNCGSNDNVCPTTANGSPVCNSGQCSITCATGFTLSAGKCVNTGTDINNCGGAGKVCPAVANGTPVCNAGTCSATCTAPFTLSGGKCINTSTDPSNCGTAGKVCPAVTNGTPTCSAGSCSAACAPGYTLANGACTNTNTDVNNCGGPGKTCPAVANGTPVCNAGSCSATCAAGYTLSAGKCINTTNDVNNCGGAGKTCPAVTNGTPVCNAGTCGATCATGYSSTDGKTCNLTCKDGSVLVNGKCGRITGCTTNADCVAQTGSATSYCYLSSDGNACFAGSTNAAGSPSGSACGYSSNLAGDDNGCATGLVCLNHVCTATTTNDPNNCGRTGNVCPTPTNGFRTCQAGTCGITCNSGYTPSGSTCVNTAGDTSNCGAIGNKCAASGSGVASSTCVAGKCQVSCSSGYTPSADKTTCNSVCADGSYLNGLTCSRYGCSTNAQCQTQTGRTDSACFNGLCYTSSSNTVGLPAGSPCGLSPISSGDDNQCAAGLVCVYYTCYNANSPTACGASRTVCPTPANGVATCTVGTCGFTCKTGYMPNASGTGCILNPSAKPLKKKRGQAGPELCPKGESACPIVGSASFGSFVNSSDRVKDFAHSLGGYECVDTASDLQSCGGCASLGTGFDCTRIAHSSEVGCSSGKCVLLSCKKGYAPALDAEKCIKVEETSKQRSAHLRQRAMRRKDISH